MNREASYGPIAHGLLRIVTGLMFWQHGAQKLFGWLTERDPTIWFSWPRGVAGILEFFGGILIILGVKTRWVAFILAGEMAVTYWWRHFDRAAFMPIVNRGELPVLFCFIFLFLWANGPGRFSVDGLLERERATD